MGLKDQILAHETRAPMSDGSTYKCRIAKYVATLDEGERKEMEEVLADPLITSASIYRWLKDQRNYYMAESAISKHRKGTCPCR